MVLLGPVAAAPAAAQDPQDTSRVTITGQVVDRLSGLPIRGALVRFSETDFQARTDSRGQFTLSELLRGSYMLRVEAPGYAPFERGLRVARSGSLQIPMEPAEGIRLRTASASALPARILGHALEMESGKSIEGAEVSVSGVEGPNITDSRGRFVIAAVPPGWRTISVAVMGRAPLADSVFIEAGQTVDMEIRLAVQPVQLDPMLIVATHRDPYLEDVGFFYRREQGYSGQSMTRQSIEERDPRTLGDLLAVIPGVRVQHGGAGGFEVRLRRAIQISPTGGVGCIPAVYLDDVPVDAGWLHNIPPTRVEGLEVYTGANAPLRYNDPCGVILVWTRRGNRGGGR